MKKTINFDDNEVIIVDPDSNENHYDVYMGFGSDSKDLRDRQERIFIKIMKNEFLNSLPLNGKKQFKIMAREIQLFTDGVNKLNL